MRSFTKRVTFGGKTTPFWCSFVPCPVKAWTCRHMTALNTKQLGLSLYEVVVKFHKYLDFIVGFGREYGREPELIYSPITAMYLSPYLSIKAGNLGPSVTSCSNVETDTVHSWKAGPGEAMTVENLHLQGIATPYRFLATFCPALFPDDRRLLRRRH